MHRNRAYPAVFALAVALPLIATGAAPAEVALPGIFSDHMVLQQAMKTPIWGTAEAGEAVTVTFRGQSKAAVADAAGKWRVVLDAMDATAQDDGFELTVKGRNAIVLKDVLVGEVWLGSGQSNMVWPPRNIPAGKRILEDANLPRLRLSSDTLWPNCQTPNTGWVRATPQTVEPFSAILFCFGRQLLRDANVPVGLICRAVSGSAAGPWITAEGFAADEGCQAEYKRYLQNVYPGLLDAYKANLAKWGPLAAAAKAKADAKLAILDRSPHELKLKLDPAVRKTVPALAGGQDHMMQAAEFVLPFDGNAYAPTFKFRLKWYNGAEHAGKVLKVARDGNATRMELELDLAADAAVAGGKGVYSIEFRRDGWACAGTFTGKFGDLDMKGPVTGGPLQAKDEMPPRKPPEPSGPAGPSVGGHHAQFISPIVGYALRGVLWDQGESGTAVRDVSLPTLMNALVRSWRKDWGQGDFPFLFVQKPSGGGWRWQQGATDAAGKPVARPALPDTTKLDVRGGFGREHFQQLMRIPNSVMAIALDLDSGLHPDGKEAYSRRLDLCAQAMAYGKKVQYMGPRYASHKIDGDKVRVEFDDAAAGLEARGGEPLQGFLIAGEDQVWHWAEAKIDATGKAVVVSSASVPKPAAVRYAWAGDVSWANLFNKDGLPALTFRTDTWAQVEAPKKK